MTKVRVCVTQGAEGPSLSIEDGNAEPGRRGGCRVAGPKPWGGGHTIYEWVVEAGELESAIEEAARLTDGPTEAPWSPTSPSSTSPARAHSPGMAGSRSLSDNRMNTQALLQRMSRTSCEHVDASVRFYGKYLNLDPNLTEIGVIQAHTALYYGQKSAVAVRQAELLLKAISESPNVVAFCKKESK